MALSVVSGTFFGFASDRRPVRHHEAFPGRLCLRLRNAVLHSCCRRDVS